MKIQKLDVVLEKRDFRDWARQYLRSAVPDSISIASVSLNGGRVVIKGEADYIFKSEFKMEFEMMPAKDGDALLLKLKKTKPAKPFLNFILKMAFPNTPGLEYSWCDEGIAISFNRLLRPMGISVAKLTGVRPNRGSVCLSFE